MSQPLANAPATTLVVDCRGRVCPNPLLETRKAIGTVTVGEVVEVVSDAPETEKDLPAWAEKVGHHYMGFMPGDGCQRHFVRRGI